MKIDYSLGDPPDESKEFSKLGKKFSVNDDPEGIYLTFDVPANTQGTWVSIEGIGSVFERFQNPPIEKDSESNFFYPFLTPGKEYTIRVKFTRQEETNDEGFVINYTKDDGVIAWFETKAKAGANSKGEVRLKYKGDIEVKDRGYFRFTKKPEFYNESALTGNNYDWIENIGLVEGISWEHGNARKTKWNVEINIPKKDLTKWRDLYRDIDKSIKIDFLCIRPRLEYSHKNTTYTYQWEGFCYETPYLGNEALQRTNIDINNPADVAKIKGTWTQSGEWDETEHFLAKVHGVFNETLIIDDTNVKKQSSYTYTKLNGNAFTKEELSNMVDSEPYLNPIPSSEIDTVEMNLTKDENILKFEKYFVYYEQEESYYQYYIYKLDDDHNILSNNGKTLTTKHEYTESLSEFFGNINDYEHNYFKTVELKLSKDGSELWVSEWDDEEDEYFTYSYKKQ